MPHDPLSDLRDGARDVVYTGVGLGVLGFQQLQVRRRELESALGTGLTLPLRPSDLGRLVARLPFPR